MYLFSLVLSEWDHHHYALRILYVSTRIWKRTQLRSDILNFVIYFSNDPHLKHANNDRKLVSKSIRHYILVLVGVNITNNMQKKLHQECCKSALLHHVSDHAGIGNNHLGMICKSCVRPGVEYSRHVSYVRLKNHDCLRLVANSGKKVESELLEAFTFDDSVTIQRQWDSVCT